MCSSQQALAWARGLAGLALGGTLGWFVVGWALDQGLYTPLVPAALLGIGCGWLSGIESWCLAGVCGVAGLALGVLSEWHHFPFVADESLSFFLTHLHELQTMHLLMIVLGGALAVWFGRGSGRAVRRSISSATQRERESP